MDCSHLQPALCLCHSTDLRTRQLHVWGASDPPCNFMDKIQDITKLFDFPSSLLEYKVETVCHAVDWNSSWDLIPDVCFNSMKVSHHV